MPPNSQDAAVEELLPLPTEEPSLPAEPLEELLEAALIMLEHLSRSIVHVLSQTGAMIKLLGALCQAAEDFYSMQEVVPLMAVHTDSLQQNVPLFNQLQLHFQSMNRSLAAFQTASTAVMHRHNNVIVSLHHMLGNLTSPANSVPTADMSQGEN